MVSRNLSPLSDSVNKNQWCRYSQADYSGLTWELLLLLRRRHTTFSTWIFVWRYAKGTTLTQPGQLSQQYDNHKKTLLLWHIANIVHLQVWLFIHLQTKMCPYLLWRRSTKSHWLRKRYWKRHCKSCQFGTTSLRLTSSTG